VLYRVSLFLYWDFSLLLIFRLILRLMLIMRLRSIYYFHLRLEFLFHSINELLCWFFFLLGLSLLLVLLLDYLYLSDLLAMSIFGSSGARAQDHVSLEGQGSLGEIRNLTMRCRRDIRDRFLKVFYE